MILKLQFLKRAVELVKLLKALNYFLQLVQFRLIQVQRHNVIHRET